jgi:hypothetical protein
MRMRGDEFLVWDADDATGRRWQLVDGEPVLMAPAADVHGSIQAELARLLGNHLLAVASRCRVVDAPGIIPRVRANENFRVSELAVTCWAYTTIPSVREILAVRTTRMEVELLRRDVDSNWPAPPVIIRQPETLELTSIGYDGPVTDIYRTAGLTQ